jgi:hypothetical protein
MKEHARDERIMKGHIWNQSKDDFPEVALAMCEIINGLRPQQRATLISAFDECRYLESQT